jgi:hypothetical protein
VSRDPSGHDNRNVHRQPALDANHDGPLKELTMWMPDWLYERLPHLYLAAALACLTIFGASVAAGLSALLFSSAAALTMLQRKRARAPAAHRTGPRMARR